MPKTAATAPIAYRAMVHRGISRIDTGPSGTASMRASRATKVSGGSGSPAMGVNSGNGVCDKNTLALHVQAIGTTRQRTQSFNSSAGRLPRTRCRNGPTLRPLPGVRNGRNRPGRNRRHSLTPATPASLRPDRFRRHRSATRPHSRPSQDRAAAKGIRWTTSRFSRKVYSDPGLRPRFSIESGIRLIMSGKQCAQSVRYSGLANVVGTDKDVQARLKFQCDVF